MLAAAALVATVVLGAQTWHKAFRADGNDLTSYLLSARALWDGQSPYGLETPFPYLYPLFLAFAIGPLTLLPYGAAVIAWFAASVAALGIVLKRWSHGSKLAMAAAVLVTFNIIQNNLLNGQVNFLVVLCCLLAVAAAGPPQGGHYVLAVGAAGPPQGGHSVGLATPRRRELVAGAWLGVGIAVKLMPALLVVYFLVRRRFLATLVALVSAVALALLPSVLLIDAGVESGFLTAVASAEPVSRITALHWQYVRDVLTPMTATADGPALSYSVASVVHRVLGTGPALWIDALCAAAVLGACLTTGLAGASLPFAGVSAGQVGIAPVDSLPETAGALWSPIASHPTVPSAVVIAGAVAALLPWVHRRFRFGVAVVGVVLMGAAVAAGAGIASTLLATFVWAIAAVASLASRLPGPPASTS